ncbi:MAG: SpoIIE family protein phosphatase [Tolumonas sp.]|nr:SpoIIE family protein phosphatase [Tolumonas sp.]
MPLLLGSLRGKFVLLMAMAYIVTIALTLLAFNSVSSSITRTLGVRFAEKQVLYEQARIRAPILKEIALSRKLSDSPVLQAWARNESDVTLKAQALQELESFRQSFQDGSFFYVIDSSRHYYYNDHQKQYSGKELRFTLEPQIPQDKWYFVSRTHDEPYSLNVDHDVALDETKVWINTQIRTKDGRYLGMAGTGMDLTAFVHEFIKNGHDGVTNILIDDSAAIQAHPNREYIDFNSQAKDAKVRFTLFNLLAVPQDRIALRNAITELQAAPEQVKTLFLTLDGHVQLVGLAYLPEMHWLNVTVMDLDKLIGGQIFSSLILVLVLALFVCLLIVTWILQALVLKRLDPLDGAARQVAAGNYSARLTDKRNDEIGRLAVGFNRMAETIRDNTSLLEERVQQRTEELHSANLQLEQKNKQILDSIRYARMIQSAILPRYDLLSRYLAEHMVIWLPRDVVGGDFYFLQPDDDGCYIGVVDCTGHGIPGAFMSMTANAVIRQVLTGSRDKPLSDLLLSIDEQLRLTLQHSPDSVGLDYGLDIGLCRLSAAEIEYAGCGVDLYLSGAGEVQRLSSAHRGLGYKRRTRRDKPITTYRLPLSADSRCYLVSDGLLDQSGEPNGYGFGRQRFQQLLLQWQSLSLTEQQVKLVEELSRYQGDFPQRDDITVFGFAISPLSRGSV